VPCASVVTPLPIPSPPATFTSFSHQPKPGTGILGRLSAGLAHAATACPGAYASEPSPGGLPMPTLCQETYSESRQVVYRQLPALTHGSTLADLPSHECQVSSEAPGHIVANAFENHSELPGVIVRGAGLAP